MATIVRAIFKGYRYLNEDVADPRTNNWFLIGSPWIGLALVGFYLYFVQKLGPQIMQTREPFKLERIMQIYNIFQIVINAFIFYRAIVLGWGTTYSFRCEPVDYRNEPHPIQIAATVWLFLMVKILDLVDTIFFVLRKKQNQVSFLHVYHHTGMVMGCWAAVKYFPGGHVTFLGLINSFVHVVMYTHYLVTSLKLGKPWWKKHITQLQLTQFIVILLHFSQLLWTDCGFPIWPAVFFIPQNIFMITLFGDFYYRTYIKKSGAKKVEQNGITTESTNGKLKTQ